MNVFTDRSASADGHTLQPEENAMTQRSKTKLDTIAFVRTLLALIGVFIFWVFAILPRNPY